MTIVQHSTVENRWYTPPEIVEPARRVLGVIDMDPASDAYGNSLVQARYVHTKESNGVTGSWAPGSVFMNPPGGYTEEGKRPLVLMFWTRLMLEIAAGRATHAIVIAFTLEQLSRTQGHDVPAMADYPLCIAAKRPRYYTPKGERGPSPPHSGAIVYVPGSVDRTEVFAKEFATIGKIMLPYMQR